MDNINTVPDFRNDQDPNNITDLAFQSVEVPRPEEKQEMERARDSVVTVHSEKEMVSEIEKQSQIHSETDLPNVGGDLDAFLPIKKVPLSTETGGYSKAHSIRLEKDGQEVEMGTVTSDYVLVSNFQLMDVIKEIMDTTGMIFKPVRKFFNGKQFRYLWRIVDAGLEVKVPQIGDVMGLMLQTTNSYDGSLKAGISIILERLFCLNGQTSNEYGWGFSFRHYRKDGIMDWKQNILTASQILQGRQIELLPQRFADACGKLVKPIDFPELAVIRNNNDYLGNLPAQQFAQTMDKMMLDGMVTDPDHYTAYDLFNAGTNVLWHQEKMTTATFKNNALVVDGMLKYGKDTWDNPNPVNPNQMSIPMDDNPAHS